MIRKKLIPVVAFILTVAFIASCSSSNPMLDKAQSNVQNQDYATAKTEADKYIKKFPDKPLGYYWKGVALGQEGQEKSKTMPADASPLYKSMQDAFDSAQKNASNADKKPEELSRISNIKVSIWRFEHNAAVKLATDDSLKEATENPIQKAHDHLKNAILVEPDSALSWNVLARINGMQENYSDAAQAQNKYLELKPNSDAKEYLLLAQYYRYNKNTEKEIAALQKLQDKYPENVQGIEMLADAYSNNGQSQKAIQTVRDLVKKDPSNPRYRQALGTQIYQSTTALQDSIKNNNDQIFPLRKKLSNATGNEKSQLENKIEKLRNENEQFREKNSKFTGQALTHLKKVAEEKPNDDSIFNKLGIIYQNEAALLFDQRNVTVDNAQAKKLDTKAKEKLREAMTNYEKAAQLKPDNKKYWRSLFQVYTTLGKDKKAKEAEKKAGMK